MNTDINQIIDKVFAGCKKITPALIAVSLTSGLILFLPHKLLEKMGLDKIPPSLKSAIGLIFIVTMVLIVTIVFWEITNKWYKRYQNKIVRKRFRNNFINLPIELKAIIIEMMDQPSKKIILDSAEGSTLYLLSNSFIFEPQQIFSPSYDNKVWLQYVPNPWLIDLYYSEPELFKISK